MLRMLRFYGPGMAFYGVVTLMVGSIIYCTFLRTYASLLYVLNTCLAPDHPRTAEILLLVCVLCGADVVWASQPGLDIHVVPVYARVYAFFYSLTFL